MEIGIVAALAILYVLLAKPLTRMNVTAPMLFLVAGAVLYSFTGELSVTSDVVHVLAEVTLVVILFHDASTVRLGALRGDSSIPLRLLAIGFPLALGATFTFVGWLLPALGVAGALLIAGAVTPTDAGLGAPTILNPLVPVRIRRALNVESGLNDGLATPVVLFALAALASEEGAVHEKLLSMAVGPVALAIIIAVVVALFGARFVDVSAARHWSSPAGRAVAVLVLPIACFGVALAVDANAFICAFVAGLVFGSASSAYRRELEMSETLDSGANLIGYVVWFLAGGLVELTFANGIRWQWIVIALAVLTVLRILPVAISLIGTGLRWQSVLFVGWFGPRGLATIVFALLALEELGPNDPAMIDIAGVVAVTVILSVFAHGISAGILARRYGQWVDRTKPKVELKAVSGAEIDPKPRGHSRLHS
ncbi:MAG: cation:proton antiporter [Candidatus Nanopelagicales bacterium]